VSEALISQLEVRMTLEQLEVLPPVIFVGLPREVTEAGLFCYSIEETFNLIRALFVPVPAHGYRRTGAKAKAEERHHQNCLDMVCGCCGKLLTASWTGGPWTLDDFRNDHMAILRRCANRSDFREHVINGACAKRFYEYDEPS